MTNDVTIIAGPCSVDENNLKQIYEIADITIDTLDGPRKAVYGTRVVGLKSRTNLEHSTDIMGMDFEAIMHNITNPDDQQQMPSIELAAKIVADTGLLVATELLIPHIQLPLFARAGIPAGKLLGWSPAVNMLGWPIYETAVIAKKQGWAVGIKNGKWLGEELRIAESPDYIGETSMEKAWKGLADYAIIADEVVMIQRGVDVPGKGDFRNAVIHHTALRVKKALLSKYPGKTVKMYLDPSHSYGPKLRAEIPQAIVDAMKINIDATTALYDGAMVEVGDSKTDTEQHITVAELRWVINEISKIRPLRTRA